MKTLKIIGIIVGVLVAAVLIIPLFLPATAEVSSETEIALEPSQVFPMVASFRDREAWDPWVAMDSTTVVTVESKPGFVGSTYAWEGERLGTGKMEVASVTENESIESRLWFGDMKEPATVRWAFKPTGGGTHATWTYSQNTSYPFSRLGMAIGKGMLKKSLDAGLVSLRKYLEENPPMISPLGPITTGIQQPFFGLAIKRTVKMENLSEQFEGIFGRVMQEVEKQQLQITGPGFARYADYDEATGMISFMAGFMVGSPGRQSGEVLPVSFNEMRVVQAVHTGPYEDFTVSYGLLEEYIEENGLDTTGESFEFYTVCMPQEPDPAKWQTLITYPLK
jgi:hypothetical protein